MLAEPKSKNIMTVLLGKFGTNSSAWTYRKIVLFEVFYTSSLSSASSASEHSVSCDSSDFASVSTDRKIPSTISKVFWSAGFEVRRACMTGETTLLEGRRYGTASCSFFGLIFALDWRCSSSSEPFQEYYSILKSE